MTAYPVSETYRQHQRETLYTDIRAYLSARGLERTVLRLAALPDLVRFNRKARERRDAQHREILKLLAKKDH